MRLNSILTTTLIGLTFSATAQAGLIVEPRRGGIVGDFQQISFHLTGYTGPDALFVPAPGETNPERIQNTVSSISGTFRAIGQDAVLNVPGSVSQWPGRTTNASADSPNPWSFVNFDSRGGEFVRNPSVNTPTSFSGAWLTADDASRLRPLDLSDDEFDQTLVARIFVTPEMDVEFIGLFNSRANVGQPLEFTSVPEPAAFGLLAAGALVTLRRRRA